MMRNLLAAFPVVIDIPVAWGEMDAFGHVNNIIYFRYFESARIAYFDHVGYEALMEEEGLGPILAATSCRYRVPLTFPDTVSVGARVASVDTDRFRMEYRV
ncbi:MAG: acyl-CoA thioesterase, partial [Thermodesulfobacteriota bacterium]